MRQRSKQTEKTVMHLSILVIIPFTMFNLILTFYTSINNTCASEELVCLFAEH